MIAQDLPKATTKMQPTLTLSFLLCIAGVYCHPSLADESPFSLKYEPEDAYPTCRTFPYQNTSLPWDERVDDLVSRLSLHEMMVQMARGGAGELANPAPGIPRLGFGPYIFNSNCHRGEQDAPSGNATAFPQSIGLGATFDRQVWKDVGTVASVETRGKHNDYVRDGVFAKHTGASCYSPVINVVRDSRWGRIQETSGEDPFMNGELAGSFIKGLHGDDPRFVRVTGGCVLYDAYSGPENIPVSRHSFNAIVNDEDLYMTYLPSFKICFRSGAFSSMCSYNRLNGVPACANKRLLTDILRTAWKFKGYVVSDQAAVEFIITRHKYLKTYLETAAACVNAGVNQELSNNLINPVFMYIEEAVKKGMIDESLVRDRVKPLFYTRMRLGQFDPAETNPYTKLNSSVTMTPEHQAKALEVTMKSFVLLKNNGVLPVKSSDYKNVAMIGPMSDNYGQMFGNHIPRQDRSFAKTPYQGMKTVFPNIEHKNACEKGTHCTSFNKRTVEQLAKGKDLIIAAFGTGPAVEREGHDRADLNLPGVQREMLETIIKFKGKAKLVVILLSAGPLNVTFADESESVDAIMECFFPGQATGEAIANVLTNKGGRSSPGGRVPLTWPKYATQLPPMVNYSMKGRTYRYLKTAPLYPFGYGLSYSTFHYREMQISPVVPARGILKGFIRVKNTGPVDADEVIQCYISWDNKSLPVPERQLGFFTREHISSGIEIKRDFSISYERWAFWENKQWNVKAGLMHIYCGGQQPNQEKKVPSNVIHATFKVGDNAVFDDSEPKSAIP